MHKKFGMYLSLAVIAALCTLLFFPVSTDKSTLTALALAVALCVLQVGAVWFFLSSLRTFKRQLKIAYYILSVGIILFGLTEIQFPLMIIFDFGVPILSLLPLLFYLASALLMYLSARKLIHLLEIRSHFASIPVVCMSAVGILLAVFFLPLPFLPDEARFAMGLFAIGTTFFFAAAVLTWHSSRVIGEVYKRATRYLALAFTTLVGASAHELIVKLVWEDGWYIAYGITLWPYVLASGLLLAAGIAFKTSSATSAPFLNTKNYVDVITSLVGLTHNSQAIDKVLDKVRAITAKSPDLMKISKDDKEILLGVYVRIENFLITSDPLRKFTKAEIRLNLPENFSNDLSKYEMTTHHIQK